MEKGGLSGRGLLERKLEVVKYGYEERGGKLLIIGSGGILSCEDGMKMLRKGG
nr:hypothetical protein [Staphylococcus epidermidis]